MIGAIRSKSRDTVAATIQRLARNVRLVFDCLRLTNNSRCRQTFLQVQVGLNNFAVMHWLIIQQQTLEDYVIPTGQQGYVRDFVAAAARELRIKMRWRVGRSAAQRYDTEPGACVIAMDPHYFRPTEVETLLGDATKARECLGWSPEISFDELVTEMMREDLHEAERDALSRRAGYPTRDHLE